jgi:hypothetical protein
VNGFSYEAPAIVERENWANQIWASQIMLRGNGSTRRAEAQRALQLAEEVRS